MTIITEQNRKAITALSDKGPNILRTEGSGISYYNITTLH